MSWSTPPTPMAMFTSNDQAVPDIALIVEGLQINAHKSYLSLISPVFKAMFEHPTRAAETGQVYITDFTSKTVKQAIDYLYGQALTDATHMEVFDIYRFVDKYDVDAARKILVKCFEGPITSDNFIINAVFAWIYSNETIMMNCANYIAPQVVVVISTSNFLYLDVRLILELLQQTIAIFAAKIRLAFPALFNSNT
uniref:BTB domain-containing protein n=1 Tax=Panagrellus redivivus TaxID=6233 RepID=A0A7E4UT77_PANRE